MTWSAIKTTNGKIALDGVGQDVNITHEFFIRFDDRVTSENFIQDEAGRRYRIVSVENYEERNEYLRLLTTERGYNEAAKA
jgi:SPP1 family predicted phage head-tail adaptor